MLTLVAPTSMSADQQTLWLASAVDALDGIGADEVAHISAEIRRSVTRPSQIVPAIAARVAERRAEQRKFAEYRSIPRKAEPVEPRPYKPFTADEIERMPKWLRDTGLRVGFLKRVGDRIVDGDCAS